MVQEYLEGDTLREPLKKGALPLARALDLATEIVEARRGAHGQHDAGDCGLGVSRYASTIHDKIRGL